MPTVWRTGRCRHAGGATRGDDDPHLRPRRDDLEMLALHRNCRRCTWVIVCAHRTTHEPQTVVATLAGCGVGNRSGRAHYRHTARSESGCGGIAGQHDRSAGLTVFLTPTRRSLRAPGLRKKSPHTRASTARWDIDPLRAERPESIIDRLRVGNPAGFGRQRQESVPNRR